MAFPRHAKRALGKWDHDRILGEVVRVIRMTRPLVLISVFVGAPTDGHGQHQVAGELTQEAYLAAGDPTKYPEQLREGLRPWYAAERSRARSVLRFHAARHVRLRHR